MNSSTTHKRYLRFAFLLLCLTIACIVIHAAEMGPKKKSMQYRLKDGTIATAILTDSISGQNWILYIAVDETTNKKGLVVYMNDTLRVCLSIDYQEIAFTQIKRYCKVEDRYECFLYDISTGEKHKIRKSDSEQLIIGLSDDHGLFISDGGMILFQDGYKLNSPLYGYTIERDSTDRLKVLCGDDHYFLDDRFVSSAWKVKSIISLGNDTLGNYFISDFINDTALIACFGKEKVLISFNKETYDTLDLSKYQEVSTITNTDDYVLCKETDSLIYILDWKNNQRHLLDISNQTIYLERASYLGNRHNEPIFLYGAHRLIGLNGFYSFLDFALSIETNKRRKPNEVFITYSKSVGVWVRLDEIPSGKRLTSVFDSKDFVEEWFKITLPDTSEQNIKSEIEFIYIIPRLRYNARLKQNILFWISECFSLSGDYVFYVPFRKSTESDVLNFYKSLFIDGYVVGDEIKFDFGGYEFSRVERILDTRDYVSFVIDNSIRPSGGTGYGSSFATTFDKRTNKRLNLNDIISTEARPVMEEYLRGICQYIVFDSLVNTSVALGSDGINFIYGRYCLAGASIERFVVPYEIIGKWMKIPYKDFKDNMPYKRKLTFEDYEDEEEDHDKDITTYTLSEELGKKFKRVWFPNSRRDSLIAEDINDGRNLLNLENKAQTDPSHTIEKCKWALEERGDCGVGVDLFEDIIQSAQISLAKKYILGNDLQKAKMILEEVIQAESLIDGSVYNNRIDAYRVLSDIAIKEKDLAKLIDYQNTISDLLTKHFMDVFKSSTRDVRKLIWNQYRNWFFSEVQESAFLTQDSVVLTSAYNALLFSKGLLLNTEISFRNYIINSKNEELIEKYNQLEKLKKSIKIAERYRDDVLIMELEEKIKQVEALLMKEVAYSNYSHLQGIQMDQVLKNLRQGELAIEFVNAEKDNDTTYYALILKRDSKFPRIYQLFNERQLQSINSENNRLEILYDLVWNPLENELKDINTIFFSPSGKLHTIPVEYAIMPTTRECLYNLYDIHRLSSTREIAHVRDSIFQNKKDQGTSLLIGGLNYDVLPNIDSRPANDAAPSSLLRSAVSHREKIRMLPGTKEEIIGIAPYAKMLTTNDSVMILTDSQGTESQFKEAIKEEISILHFATHGFFLTDDELDKLSRNDYFYSLSQDMRDIEEKNLTRSGLVFAGINQYLKGHLKPNDSDDGLLTTLEISTLDLNRVELAVLSACNTGDGNVSSDGVYGLQRGLKKAGTKSLLMSLWPVNDDATKLLMIKFYEQLSVTHDKHQALRNAQNYLREYSSGKYSNPIYWAAFILLDGFDE